MSIHLVHNPDLNSRALRAFWRLVWLFFGFPSPVALHRWRCFLLRVFGARIEGRCFVYPTTRVWAPWNLHMHEGSCLGPEVDCYNVAPVILAEGATVSQKSYLCTASHDFDHALFPLIGGTISIGRHAWIAADAFVGPGITIAAHSVVLARAVVVRDTELRAVVGGNPARFIRQRRFSHTSSTESLDG